MEFSIYTLLIPLIAALPGIWAAIAAYRKAKGDAVSSLTGSALALVKGIEERLKVVEAELEETRTELERERRLRVSLETRVASLESDNGHLRGENERLTALLAAR